MIKRNLKKRSLRNQIFKKYSKFSKSLTMIVSIRFLIILKYKMSKYYPSTKKEL